MNTKKVAGDDQTPQTEATSEELDTEQMEGVTGGVKSISWAGSGGEDNPTERSTRATRALIPARFSGEARSAARCPVEARVQ